MALDPHLVAVAIPVDNPHFGEDLHHPETGEPWSNYREVALRMLEGDTRYTCKFDLLGPKAKNDVVVIKTALGKRKSGQPGRKDGMIP